MSAYGEMAFGGLVNAGSSIFSNWLAKEREDIARKENYRLGEMAAQNADARTRALYHDLQSPQALLQQYKDAGLSPSLMFASGGAGGATPAHAAQGTGAAGISPTTFGMDLLQGAQLAAINAQTEKTKAETANISKDTDLKTLEVKLNELSFTKYKDEQELLQLGLDKDGKQTSLYELAGEYFKFDDFLNAAREMYGDSITKETQINTLRSIYEARTRFARDITILSEDQVSSQFQLQILQKLDDNDWQNLTAEAAISDLKKSKAANELTETQKEAWNNLIDRLGKKGSTMRDIVVVLGMILGNFASNSGLRVQLGRRDVNMNYNK